MTREQLKKLFPLEGEITKNILMSSNKHDIHNCPGANTLRETLQKNGVPFINEELSWGAVDGSFYLEGDNQPETHIFGIGAIWVRTEEHVNFMNVKEPMNVTFELYDPGVN